MWTFDGEPRWLPYDMTRVLASRGLELLKYFIGFIAILPPTSLGFSIFSSVWTLSTAASLINRQRRCSSNLTSAKVIER
jgi:hypothetical protein